MPLCVTAKLAADVRFGSIASEAIRAGEQRMSALPPKAEARISVADVAYRAHFRRNPRGKKEKAVAAGTL
jgi:hypothetical protein